MNRNLNLMYDFENGNQYPDFIVRPNFNQLIKVKTIKGILIEGKMQVNKRIDNNQCWVIKIGRDSLEYHNECDILWWENVEIVASYRAAQIKETQDKIEYYLKLQQKIYTKKLHTTGFTKSNLEKAEDLRITYTPDVELELNPDAFIDELGVCLGIDPPSFPCPIEQANDKIADRVESWLTDNSLWEDD